VDVDELLLLLEVLESSLGVLVEPARLVLSTLVMVVLCIEQLMEMMVEVVLSSWSLGD
jgi:hypothetical protein